MKLLIHGPREIMTSSHYETLMTRRNCKLKLITDYIMFIIDNFNKLDYLRKRFVWSLLFSCIHIR